MHEQLFDAQLEIRQCEVILFIGEASSVARMLQAGHLVVAVYPERCEPSGQGGCHVVQCNGHRLGKVMPFAKRTETGQCARRSVSCDGEAVIYEA